MNLDFDFKRAARVVLLTPFTFAGMCYLEIAADAIVSNAEPLWQDIKTSAAKSAMTEAQQLEMEMMKNGGPPPWAIHPFPR